MYYLLIYIETLIFMTFYLVYLGVQKFFRVIGDSAEWYAAHRVHVWQPTKVMLLIEEQYEEYKKQLKKEKSND